MSALRYLVVVVAVLTAIQALADADRPKVGLVLSGGGAKGMAHVGILRVLEEMKIPVDVVVGTSAGSAVGALYASGMNVHEIEERFIEMDWVSSFRDDPGRAYRPVRRKREDWRFPVAPGIGIRADGLHLGGGIITGQNLGFILNELTRSASLVEDFDRLAIPFRAVATDLETGEQVVIGSGNLSEAIRASMSIPGVYAPVALDGRLLVDGGVANNLPVSVARELGAEVIIAVDITDPLLEREEIREAFSVVGQLTTMMTRRNTEQQLELLTDRDILIRPDLEGLSSADFYQAPALFELGASGARKHAGELRHLSVEESQWIRYRSRLQMHSSRPGLITSVRIDDQSRLAGDFLRERIRQKTGEPLNVNLLEEDLKRIYGLGYYETVSYSLAPSGAGGTELVIRVREKSWGPNYLSFGLNYEDNLENETRFNLATSLRMTGLNALGGEWATGLQLGTQPWVRTEWFQPLDYGFKRFLTLGGEYSRESLSAFDGEGERITEVDITSRQVDLAVGTELGVNGEIRLEYMRGYATVDEQVGEPVAPSGSIQSGNLNLRLVHDSLDDAFLPKSGGFAGIRGRFERPGLGSDRDFDSVRIMALGTASWRKTSITGLLFGNTVTRGVAGIENSVLLGGFRRLSAYSQGEVAGEDAVLASVFARQEFGGPYVPWFAGVGFESGNAWSSLGDARWNNLLHSGSVFAGVETFLGPLQIATAYNNEAEWSAYLSLGFSFTRLFD
ncbi:patatin-like phospholipase family protein [Marinobacter sp. ATCH36]|uniref:patatin-like phospholipase family protein n=1 Tax=Marinobacter sp. ATCH36 TaxID=2945106 RepID=UPI002020E0B5|nr:patatin-like phospholipase family protein [Marinobacter sp. ATCH36]MCL7945613.1 patatin-like phospholipase family protein [Marinobacter sp. ATCH36]